jgi:hypothetical protein
MWTYGPGAMKEGSSLQHISDTPERHDFRCCSGSLTGERTATLFSFAAL